MTRLGHEGWVRPVRPLVTRDATRRQCEAWQGHLNAVARHLRLPVLHTCRSIIDATSPDGGGADWPPAMAAWQ
jgi:hypothetical protein